MTDDIEKLELDTEETPTAEVVKTEKTYSESQVQKLVQERISREKISAKKLQDEFVQKESEYQSQLSAYEKVISQMIDKQMKEQSEPVKKLLAKLTILERLEFLSDPENKIEKKNIPSTPKNSEEVEKPRRKIGQFI